MYKLKPIYIISICVLFLFITFFVRTKAISVFGINKNTISSSDVDNYFKYSDDKKGIALQNIVLTTLKNLGLTELNEEKLITNVEKNENGDQLAVAVSLKPNKGCFGIYKRMNNNYIFIQGMSDLPPISKIKFVDAKNLNFIYVTEDIDESTGAFYKSTLAEVYYIGKQTIRNVFSTKINYSADWNEAFDNKKNPKWIKLRGKADLTINNKNNPSIMVSSDQKYLESKETNLQNSPPDDECTVLKQKNFTSVYYWDNDSLSFILGKGLVDRDNVSVFNFDGFNFVKASNVNSGDIVSITEDLSNDITNLPDPKGDYYHVLLKDGKSYYVKKSDVKLIK